MQYTWRQERCVDQIQSLPCQFAIPLVVALSVHKHTKQKRWNLDPQWQDPLDFSGIRISCLMTACWQAEIVLNWRHHYFWVSSAVLFWVKFTLISLGIILEEEELSRGFNTEYCIALLVCAGKGFCKLGEYCTQGKTDSKAVSFWLIS